MPDLEPEPLYTVIATCRTCGVEWNRAEHVPKSELPRVHISAPLALSFGAGFDRSKHPCPHSTLSDLNLHFDLKDVPE